METPLTVKINNLTYTISQVDDKDNKDFYDKENDCLKLFGQTNYVEQTIKIWKFLTTERQRKTIIHELVHAFHDAYLGSQHVKDKFDEEDICCFVESYIEEILELTNYIVFKLHNIGYIEEE